MQAEGSVIWDQGGRKTKEIDTIRGIGFQLPIVRFVVVASSGSHLQLKFEAIAARNRR